ncbi:hypothetical protein VNO77_20524 [Canavalia gladiata]|uniref:Uncharacterized protein n=1 Tax=Canavalia gladiata TaxID=3824 RepID=A0AAN9LTB6_CANGL
MFSRLRLTLSISQKWEKCLSLIWSFERALVLLDDSKFSPLKILRLHHFNPKESTVRIRERLNFWQKSLVLGPLLGAATPHMKRIKHESVGACVLTSETWTSHEHTNKLRPLIRETWVGAMNAVIGYESRLTLPLQSWISWRIIP